jgi:ABC-type Fe3+ transport system permease subunit
MRDSLYWTYVIASLAAVTASVLAVVMLILWVRARRQGRSVASAAVTFLVSVGIVGLSAGWLTYQRHDKCKPTVSRTLCEPPLDWLRGH